jgi:glycosyltransferase involved in cell wall biosynthesis
MEKPTLTVCVLAKNEICALTMGCLINASTNAEICKDYNFCQQFAIGQSDLPKVRSSQLSNWYDTSRPKDLFMFLDADQTFLSADILTSLKLIKTSDVVCGAYAKKTGGMTVQPKSITSFYRNKEGELRYGSTGFMLITYEIAHKLALEMEKIKIGIDSSAFPFFFERIVDEKETNEKNLWLSEDYSFCWLVRNKGGRVYGYISPSIGHIVPIEKYITMPTSKKWSNDSIVYYCHKTSEKWSAKSLGKGIGGSETAVIKLSSYWAKSGYEVTVFCNCDEPGVYDGVVYKHFNQFNVMDEYNILVIWRSLQLLLTNDISAKKKFIDLHDIVKQDELHESLPGMVDGIFVKSRYHASMIRNVPEEKIIVVPNGGAEEYTFLNTRDKNYLIYASSYDRGLFYMLKWGWPRIKKACPDAYLKIFYGWNVFDTIDGNELTKQKFKELMKALMSQDGVEECGRISQINLAREKSKASVHYYVGDFQEIDCISVRESAYLGAIPVVSREAHVFKEKEDYCILVDGDPCIQETQERGADVIIELLKNPQLMEKRRNSLHVPKESWQHVANRWLDVLKK